MKCVAKHTTDGRQKAEEAWSSRWGDSDSEIRYPRSESEDEKRAAVGQSGDET